jgi:hypothetical protein
LWTGQPIPEKPKPTFQPPIDRDCVKRRNAERAAEKQGPSLAKKAVNFTKAVVKHVAAEQAVNLATATANWIKAGRPTRTDAECETIHKICQECEFFDSVQDRCKVCGCGLSPESAVGWIKLMGIPDAIRMKTKSCPLKKW